MAQCKGRSNKDTTPEMKEEIDRRCWGPTLGIDCGQVKDAKLIFPEDHKIENDQISDHINLEKEKLIGV